MSKCNVQSYSSLNVFKKLCSENLKNKNKKMGGANIARNNTATQLHARQFLNCQVALWEQLSMLALVQHAQNQNQK